MIDINWEVVAMFDLKTANFESLQFQMNNLYGVELTESNRSNYLKLVNIMQMIIFYNEYCNLQLNETKQQVDDDIAQIDQQIFEQENKLIKSKRHYQKCKLFKGELKKKLKFKPNNVYGCLYCHHEFRDTLTLDRHMECHKEPPNVMPQILAIQKELQLQMTNLYEAKQQRRELEFLKQDLRYGMIAAAERNQQLRSEENINFLIKSYQEKVDKLQNILKNLDNEIQLQQQNSKKKYKDEWIEELHQQVQDNLKIKQEQEKQAQKQVEIELLDTQQKLRTQRTLLVQEKLAKSNSNLKPPSQVFIQSQKSGANHLFKRSGAGMEYQQDDSSKDEIIMEEDDYQVGETHHQKNTSSQIRQSRPKHSQNASGVSFQQDSLKGLTLFEQYDIRYQEFNALVTEMLLNRYYLRRTPFDDNVLEKEKRKLMNSFSDLDQVDNLEELLEQLKQQTKGFEKRKRYQKKKKQLKLEDKKQVEKKEKTISSFESSDDATQTDQEKDQSIDYISRKCELSKFPFKIQEEQQKENQKGEINFEAGHGYGVNAFCIDF